MTHFPAFKSLLFVFLLIQMTAGSTAEIKRLTRLLELSNSRHETTKLEIEHVKDEVELLRNELEKAKQDVDNLDGIMKDMNAKDSVENKCSCQAADNLTRGLHDIQQSEINDLKRIMNLELFSKQRADVIRELEKISSKAKELWKGFQQEKNLRKDFEMRTNISLLGINDIIFKTNHTYPSFLRNDSKSPIDQMDSTIQSLLVDVKEIKSSIRNPNSSNITIYSELQRLKDIIEDVSRGKTFIMETTTASTRTIASSKSPTSHLCTRTVTDPALILSLTKVGSRVVRGRDWVWGDQDGNPPTVGKVEKIDSLPGWVWVRWESGLFVNYRLGEGSKFDLYICE